MAPLRAGEEDSLSCDEHACDWDARGGGPSPGQSPAPGQYDDDESDGDAASQSDEDDEPACDAEHWARALADEAALRPDAAYPGKLQPVVDARARELTVDWLLAASRRHRFSLRTAVLAVNLLDRFLSRYVIKASVRWLLQLAAVACLSIASKMEEISVPHLADLQVLAEARFEPKYVMKMELLLLTTLEWRVATATPLSFLEHFLRRLAVRQAGRRRSLRAHARELLRRTLSDASFLAHGPSALAAAALARALAEQRPLWGDAAAARMHDALLTASGQPAAVTACLRALAELRPAWAAGGGGASPRGRRALAAAAAARAKAAGGADRESPTSTLDGFTALELHAGSESPRGDGGGNAAAGALYRPRRVPFGGAAAGAQAAPLLPAKRAWSGCA